MKHSLFPKAIFQLIKFFEFYFQSICFEQDVLRTKYIQIIPTGIKYK